MSIELDTTQAPTPDSPLTTLDADLQQQLEGVKGQRVLYDKMFTRVLRVQKDRDDSQSVQLQLTPITRRFEQTRDLILAEEAERDNIFHLHSVLALCGLPYKKLEEDKRSYQKEYGKMSLSVQAGRLKNPETGAFEEQGIPYGPKARLILVHLCTQALRQNSPEIEIEKSLSQFIMTLGQKPTGGKNGNIRLFKDQLNRLAACSFQLGLWNGDGKARTINTNPISSFDAWLPSDSSDGTAWSSSIHLSEGFYNTLKEHALPMDYRCLQAISHSAKLMDIMLWLSFRTQKLTKRYLLSWELLQEQFCQSAATAPRNFRRDFIEDVKNLQRIFGDDIPLEIKEKGLMLKPLTKKTLFLPTHTSLKKPLDK